MKGTVAEPKTCRKPKMLYWRDIRSIGVATRVRSQGLFMSLTVLSHRRLVCDRYEFAVDGGHEAQQRQRQQVVVEHHAELVQLLAAAGQRRHLGAVRFQISGFRVQG